MNGKGNQKGSRIYDKFMRTASKMSVRVPSFFLEQI